MILITFQPYHFEYGLGVRKLCNAAFKCVEEVPSLNQGDPCVRDSSCSTKICRRSDSDAEKCQTSDKRSTGESCLVN
ncbi:2728_t:CDS:2, partial [Entrophospora sp. SA101]